MKLLIILANILIPAFAYASCPDLNDVIAKGQIDDSGCFYCSNCFSSDSSPLICNQTIGSHVKATKVCGNVYAKGGTPIDTDIQNQKCTYNLPIYIHGDSGCPVSFSESVAAVFAPSSTIDKD